MNKSWTKGEVLVQVLGIFIARAVIGQSSPMAISLFSAMYLVNGGKVFSIICIIVGILTVLPAVEGIKYLIIILTIIILAKMSELNYMKLNLMQLGILSGIITLSISLVNNLISSRLDTAIILAIAEGVAVFAFTVVLSKGVEAIIIDKKGQAFTNEEMVSISIIIAAGIYGLPKLGGESILLQVFASLFIVLLIAYKYGSGYGAIVGFACGASTGFISGNFNQIAILCMLAILAGTFRELGRLAVTIIYFTSTILLAGLIIGINPSPGFLQEGLATVGQNNQIVALETRLVQAIMPLIAGSVLFLILPESLVCKIYNNDDCILEDSFLKQNIHMLTRERLEEFSESFRNLAEAFRSSHRKTLIENIDKERVFNDLSEDLCKNCENCCVCWSKYSSDTYQGVNKIIDVVSTDGSIMKKEVPLNFRNRCIKIEKFLLEARRLFDIEKINISCNNKLEEGREAITEQFAQIGNVLGDI